MTTTLEKRSQILETLSDKESRDALVAAEIEAGIPFQIRAMREARDWSQTDLAEAAGMSQARISLLENPDYEGAVNVKTLERLASAFDVALVVRFAPFSELLDWLSRSTDRGHKVAPYADDSELRWDEQSTQDPKESSAVTHSMVAADATNTGVRVSPSSTTIRQPPVKTEPVSERADANLALAA